jgi:tetratricopeptide (TPR) repeat protein
MFFPLLCAIAVPAPAQTAKHAAGSRQPVADAASRKQLEAYLADFQSNPEDATLRNEIVALAKSLNPAPAIPQLARANFAQATAQMNAASSAEDFKAAAKLFEQAAVQAPWYADADFSAASAYAKALDYDGAKRNLAFYLAAVRPGVDTRNAEELRLDLDRQQSAQQLQQALRQFSANPSDAARLQVIKLVQSMKTPPEIPEEARGHYVMALVFVNSAEDNGNSERAIEEFKAALLAAPWWGDAYKKLATAQTSAGRYDEAMASLNFYQLTQPAEARDTQDEIYRLKALKQRAADEQAKRQTEEQQRKLLKEQQQNQRAAIEAKKYTVEGRWYEASTPSIYFAGGESDPGCDYFVKQNGGRWVITSSCPQSKRTIDNIEVQTRQLSFRLSGHDPGFPFSEVDVTFALSSDGQTLEGRGTAYDKSFFPIGDHPVRWMRRE